MNFQMIIDVAKLGLQYPKHETAFADIIKQLANEPSATPTDDEVRVGQQEGKIQMIKLYRMRTGLGLVESKQNCEKYFADNYKSFYRVN